MPDQACRSRLANNRQVRARQRPEIDAPHLAPLRRRSAQRCRAALDAARLAALEAARLAEFDAATDADRLAAFEAARLAAAAAAFDTAPLTTFGVRTVMVGECEIETLEGGGVVGDTVLVAIVGGCTVGVCTVGVARTLEDDGDGARPSEIPLIVL
jgi:hypothetical protein